jgi:succinate dehydrogenase/fumarate reductase-like Fe-S protein
MSETATLKIWRGQDRTAGHWESFTVPFERGQSVLDGLRWIRVNKDPSLAIRYSCINANACKECMMVLDSETVYACTARLEPREMTVTPLPNKKLVRDLVTEIAPPAERFSAPQLPPPLAGEVGSRSDPGGGSSPRRKGPLPNPPPRAGEGEKKR